MSSMRLGWGLAFALAMLGCGSLLGLDDYGGTTASNSGTGAAGGTGVGTGAASCVNVLCGATCAVLDNDAKHCGACNHDCLGGECIEGECQPVLLDEGVPGESYKHLVVAGDSVYWSVAAPDEIRKIATQGGARVVVGAAPSTDFLAASATHLLASSYLDRAIYVLNLSNPGTIETLLTETDPIVGIAVDGGVAYYHRHTEQGGVRAKPLVPSPVIDIAPDQHLGFGILVQSGRVYWSTWGSGSVSLPGTIATTAVSGAERPLVLADNELKPSGIALDATYVYWIDANARIRRVQRNGVGMVDNMYAGFPSSEGEKGFGQLVQVDQTHVYASIGAGMSAGPYGLLRIEKSQREARFIVPDVAIWGLADDTMAVYYTTIVSAAQPPQLWRLAK